MYLAGGLLGLALGVVVCLLSLSLGLAPGALGLTCNETKTVSTKRELRSVKRVTIAGNVVPLASPKAFLASGSF